MLNIQTYIVYRYYVQFHDFELFTVRSANNFSQIVNLNLKVINYKCYTLWIALVFQL